MMTSAGASRLTFRGVSFGAHGGSHSDVYLPCQGWLLAVLTERCGRTSPASGACGTLEQREVTLTTRCHSPIGVQMAINAGDTLRLTFLGTCFGQRIMLDLSYRCTVGNGTATPTLLTELINATAPGAPAATEIGTSYLACLPPQYTLNEMRAQVLTPTRSAFTSVGFVGTVGTNVNPATVSADSAAITRRTLLAGRNQLSVLKIGPAPDGASAAGLITAAYTALLSTLGTRTIAGLAMPVSTAQYVPTILGPTGLSTGRDLVGFFIGTESRVMRRRVVGRGI